MNYKPKILMIAPLPPPVHGSAMMTKYIKDSNLINDSFNLDWVNLSTSRKMDEIGKKTYKKVWRFLSSYAKTLGKLCFNRYDVCYLAITCHGIGFLKDAPFALLCKLFGNKIIIHQHNKGMSKDVGKPIYRFLLKLVYKHSRVILLSENLYSDISSIVDHSQVSIVPNGIPVIERIKKTKHKIPQLLFLSNLIESKGVLVLLDACKVLKDWGCEFTCQFIGGETKIINQTTFIHEVNIRGIKDIVQYIGPKYGYEKTKAISCCDVLVFPTFYENETFGLVLLEAMQQAIPQVSTPIGAIPDIVIHNKTGLIVEPENPIDLAEKLKILLDNEKLRDSMGYEAYLHFNKQYTIEHFEKKICDVLHQTFNS